MSILEQLDRRFQKHPLISAALLTALLYVVALLIFTPTFETNDDVGLSMIASGTGLCFTPDEHLVFNNVGIGLVLKWLYTQSPGVPWYAVYLLAVQYLAFTAILYTMMTWRFSYIHVLLFVLVFAIVGVNFLVYLQFTRTAFLAVEAGIVVALSAFFRLADNPQYRPAKALCVAGGLMVLGSLIRLGSFYGACAVGLPVALLIVWQLARRSSSRGAIWRHAIVTALCVAALTSVADFANAFYYSRDPAWRDFFAFNTARANFNDFGRIRYTPETKSAFDAAGWSENDHSMILYWFFDDAKVYSLENMTTILEGRNWTDETDSLRAVPGWFRKVWSDGYLWAMWALLPLFFWQATQPRAMAVPLIVLTIAIVGMLLALMLFMKFPESRIYYPLYAFQPLLSLLLVRVGTPGPSAGRVFSLYFTRLTDSRTSEAGLMFELPVRKLMSAYLVVVLIAVGLLDYRYLRHSRAVVKANTELKAAMAGLNPTAKDVYVSWGCSFPLEAILPLESPMASHEIQILMFGCFTQSPIHNAMKERYQIDETVEALLTRPNVYLISAKELNVYFERFVSEHYAIDLDWEKRYECRQFSVWKPKSRSLSSESASQYPQSQGERASGDDSVGSRASPAKR